jgi:hypothetical protein
MRPFFCPWVVAQHTLAQGLRYPGEYGGANLQSRGAFLQILVRNDLQVPTITAMTEQLIEVQLSPQRQSPPRDFQSNPTLLGCASEPHFASVRKGATAHPLM